jgi:bifunctional non-homologous end joining protein LigD
MSAAAVDRLPEGRHWIYEVKLDGYRALLFKDKERVEIRSRKNNNLTAAYPGIVAAVRRMPLQSVVVDGEIVALDADGRPSSQALQYRSVKGQGIVYYAFDLLYLNGADLRALALEERRRRLPALLKGSGLLFSEELHGSAEEVTEAVRRLGLEGVIAKRRDSRYNAGLRSQSWVKLKLDRQQEFVVGGYRPGDQGVDAILVGFYERTQLCFAAKVRAGFTPHLRRHVFGALKSLNAARCPFADLPNTTKKSRWGEGITSEEMKTFQWVRPEIVVQIRFTEWTADQHLRHAAFMGIRSDKAAGDVRRES